MKKIIIFVLFACSFVLAEEKMVSVPESQLTEQQKTALKIGQTTTVLETAHGWVGMGKELGQAFDSALSSLTQRSNEFAQTKVGKFAMFLVAWKVLGEQAVAALNAIVHIASALLELIIFIPIFLWSYRRTCMTRRVVVSREGFLGKKTWQVVEYDPDKDFTPRIAHCLILGVFTFIWLVTLFSY
jgi:hypothetical protein